MRRLPINNPTTMDLIKEAADWTEPDEYGERYLHIYLEPDNIYSLEVEFPSNTPANYLILHFPSTTKAWFLTRSISYEGKDPENILQPEEMRPINDGVNPCLFTITSTDPLQGPFYFYASISTSGPISIIETDNL